jgi:hypothetical protein
MQVFREIDGLVLTFCLWPRRVLEPFAGLASRPEASGAISLAAEAAACLYFGGSSLYLDFTTSV